MKMGWLIQKVWVRTLTHFLPTPATIQLRKVAIGSSPIVSGIETTEYIGINNYKEISLNRRILEIKNAKLNPKTGIVWVRQGLVAESTIWEVASLKRYEPRPQMALRINGKVTCLADNGYFHFITEDLPRTLQVLELYPYAKLVVSDAAAQYVKDLTTFLTNECIVASTPLNCENLIISEKILGGIMTINDLALLKSLQSKLPKPDINQKKMVFIKRTLGKSNNFDEARGLQFQELIAEDLQSKGFQICQAEALTLAEQIELFSSTTVLAGFHGAGLSNQVWMPKGSSVIEYSHERVTQHYSYLANLCNHTYQQISIPAV